MQEEERRSDPIRDVVADEIPSSDSSRAAPGRLELVRQFINTADLEPGDDELTDLPALARWLRERKRNRFLFTAPPLRLPGAVGSPAAAVATV